MLYMQLGANEFQRKRRHSGINNAQINSLQILKVNLLPVFRTRHCIR